MNDMVDAHIHRADLREQVARLLLTPEIHLVNAPWKFRFERSRALARASECDVHNIATIAKSARNCQADAAHAARDNTDSCAF
jgi:hypothetical protein